MHVRLATVGPLLGTRPVSALSIVTHSAGTPRVRAARPVNTAIVPCPISVEAVRTRISPLRVRARATRLARKASPLPVKPAPWWHTARPIPRQVECRRLRFQRAYSFFFSV